MQVSHDVDVVTFIHKQAYKEILRFAQDDRTVIPNVVKDVLILQYYRQP